MSIESDALEKRCELHSVQRYTTFTDNDAVKLDQRLKSAQKQRTIHQRQSAVGKQFAQRTQRMRLQPLHKKQIFVFFAISCCQQCPKLWLVAVQANNFREIVDRITDNIIVFM